MRLRERVSHPVDVQEHIGTYFAFIVSYVCCVNSVSVS